MTCVAGGENIHSLKPVLKKQSTSHENIFIFERKTQQQICCNNKNKLREFLTTDQSKEIVKTWVKVKYVEELTALSWLRDRAFFLQNECFIGYSTT